MFSVYPRGGGAGFWDKLCPCGPESCAITHTNTLRTATRSPGRVQPRRNWPLNKYTHLHTSPLAFLAPTLCRSLCGHCTAPPMVSLFRRQGPQTLWRSRCWSGGGSFGTVPLHCFSRSQPDSSVLQICHQPIIIIAVFHCDLAWAFMRSIVWGFSLPHV